VCSNFKNLWISTKVVGLISIFIVYLISEIDKLKQLNSHSHYNKKKIFRGGQRKFGKGVFSAACVDV
jgi:hypothetical protein